MNKDISRKPYLSYPHTPSSAAKAAYFYMDCAGHFMCDDKYLIKRKNKKSYLLIYTLEGKGFARYKDKSYEIGKGQILFIDCMEYHEYYSDAKDLWEFKFIHFDGSSSSEYFKLIFQNYGPVIDMVSVPSIPVKMGELMNLLRIKDIQIDIKASCIIVEILTSILLATPQNQALQYSGRENMFNDVLNLIEQRYDSKLSVEEMAKSKCISAYHFSRLFRKVTGYSPYEYFTKYRINKAKSLLINSGLPIDSIAGKVGFESTSNFIKNFRKLESMTPLEFRSIMR